MFTKNHILIGAFLFLNVNFIGNHFAQAPLNFQNVGTSTNSEINRNFHGAGFFDFNGDGYDDIFVIHNVSVNENDNRTHVLLKNLGDGTFFDITSSAHVEGYYVSAQGLAAADYDNDGDLDMAIGMGNWGTLLYRNNADETFSNVSSGAGVDAWKRGRLLSFFDYNNDGYVDLMVKGDPSISLFHNKKDGTFIDRHVQAGLNHTTYPDNIYGMVLGDIDNDGDLDLFTPGTTSFSKFFINNGNGTFSQDLTRGLPQDSSYYGAVFFDYNNDGWLDFFARRKGKVAQLFRNDQDGTFTNATGGSGVNEVIPRPYFGGGISVADFNNDGFLDILAICRKGMYHKLYLNNGDDTFSNIASQANIRHDGYNDYWCAPIGDYNRDGYLDIYFCRSSPDYNGTLYQNMGGGNHWLHVLLEGVQSNRSGVGARLIAWTNGQLQMRQILGGEGYQVNSFPAEFGLGSAQMVDSLIVYWPSGIVQRGLRVPADTLVTLVEQTGTQIFDLFSISGDIQYCEGQGGIPGVQCVMTGAETGIGVSDVLGHYSLFNIEGLGDITITPAKPLGEDVGAGAVSAYDASLTARNSLGLETLTSTQERLADVDESGVIDMLDASLIARFSVGLAPVPGTSAGGWQFEPEYRTYIQPTAAYSGEDYTGYLLGDVSGDWTYQGSPGKADVKVGKQPDFGWGEDFEISLSVESGFGMLSADIWFRYDPEMLQFADAFTTDLSEGFQIITNESEPGYVRLAMYGAYAIESGGAFITLQFQDIAKPGHQTEIEWELYRLNDTDYDMDPTEVTTDISLKDGESVQGFELEHNYPNPFNPETVIRYNLQESASVRLILFDMRGRPIRTLVDGYQGAGRYEVQWDGRDDKNQEVPSGTYIGRLISGESVESIKMIKAK